jgi:hypothetical protein
MTYFSSTVPYKYTFDLLSLNITALTESEGPKILKIRIIGYGPPVKGGESWETPVSKIVETSIMNANGPASYNSYVWPGKHIDFAERGWADGFSGLVKVGIEVMATGKSSGGTPTNGEYSPGFILDDIFYVKRKIC